MLLGEACQQKECVLYLIVLRRFRILSNIIVSKLHGIGVVPFNQQSLKSNITSSKKIEDVGMACQKLCKQSSDDVWKQKSMYWQSPITTWSDLALWWKYKVEAHTIGCYTALAFGALTLFDAYSGPYTDKTHFWTALLLLVHILLFTLFAINVFGEQVINTMVTAILCLALLVLAWFFRFGIYKKMPLDILESSFLLNLGVLCIASTYSQTNTRQPLHIVHEQHS